MNSVGDLYGLVEKYEVIITGHEDTATRQIDDIWYSTQPDIDAACEIIQRHESLIAQAEANREARKQHILSIASQVTAPTRSLLADVKHQLAAISAPILRLPTECTAEIMKYFNVYNPTVVVLLVSKRWNTIAKETPQLWSKIVVADGPNSQQFLHLKGAHICKSLEHLSFVLSLAKNVLMDIELACSFQIEGFGSFVPQTRMLPHGLLIGGNLKKNTSDSVWDWPDEALKLLGAEGRSRRWRSLYITSWSGMNEAPFKEINGPFDDLRSLLIQPPSSLCRAAYEPLVAAIVQGAPRLCAIDTKDSSILQRVQGWQDRQFWRKIESYHSLAASSDWCFLSQATRLKVLSLAYWQFIPQGEPVLLPCLHTLRLLQSSPEVLEGFRLPALKTLFVDGEGFIQANDPIAVLSVESIISTNCSDVRILRRFLAPTLYHLHISCLDYFDRSPRSKAWQKTFTETFNGSQFMPRPISLHLELPVSESQLLSALFQLPQIEELKIIPRPMYPLTSKFWTALTPRGASGRKKAKQYCTKLRVMVVEIKWRSYEGGQAVSRARTLELGVEMALAREQEGQPLTHLLFGWDDGSKDEVLGAFGTLPPYPLPEPSNVHITQYPFQ